jgi:predicted transcriptional regulator
MILLLRSVTMTSRDTKSDSIDLTAKQAQALKFLAEFGPANAYQIERGANMAYSTVQQVIKGALRWQFILLLSETKNAKGVNAKAYRLTLKGLLAAVSCEADLQKTAANWARLLPLILGKLPYLDERLRVGEFLAGEGKRWRNILYDQWDDELARYEAMDHFAEWLFHSLIRDENDTAWLKAVRGDRELRLWTEEALKNENSRVEAIMGLLKCELELVKSTEDPNWSKATDNLRKRQNMILARVHH